MNNQIIFWSLLIPPWLTLFFMKKEDMKRFMPVALFAIITDAVIVEIGVTMGFWGIRETLFPLNQMQTFTYGLVPVTALWIFKYTYGRFWVYIVTNAIIDIVFAYVLIPWLIIRGIGDFLNSSFFLYIINIVHAVALYGYQVWQDGMSVQSPKPGFSPKLQPASAKPLPESQDQENRSSDKV